MRIRRSGIITKIVVFALAIYAVISLINLRAQIESASRDIGVLQAEIDAKTASNAALSYEIDNKDSDAVKEKIARDDLGLVMPGEQTFYDNSYSLQN